MLLDVKESWGVHLYRIRAKELEEFQDEIASRKSLVEGIRNLKNNHL